MADEPRNRTLTGIKFTAEIAGSIQSVSITLGGEVAELLWWNTFDCDWTSHQILEDGSCMCGSNITDDFFDDVNNHQ